VADSLPVFLLDKEKGYWAALHSGWKGTGIVLKALEIMKNAGTATEAIAAVLGPCIQSCCYCVDEERAKQFETKFGRPLPDDPMGPVTRRDESHWYINLQAANARLLSAAGVRHISYCTDCTFTDPGLGSFRREGGQSYTRMIAMAGVSL
jgi:copper oxidase (laccase) domain-containing protein